MKQSPKVIVLNIQTQISHFVRLYYMIELLDVFRSVSCVLYGILDTWYIDLSLKDLIATNIIILPQLVQIIVFWLHLHFRPKKAVTWIL